MFDSRAQPREKHHIHNQTKTNTKKRAHWVSNPSGGLLRSSHLCGSSHVLHFPQIRDYAVYVNEVHQIIPRIAKKGPSIQQSLAIRQNLSYALTTTQRVLRTVSFDLSTVVALLHGISNLHPYQTASTPFENGEDFIKSIADFLWTNEFSRWMKRSW